MKNPSVNCWEEKVAIPTYGTGMPDKNPMFFERRIYQGSSGVVYPNPVIEKILDEKEDKEYTGLFLENEYLKIMLLPELGGRVQTAYDKIKQRHFIYHNQVIKPALVGLTGPWISGGIEFNWPQHHRPSTFEPVDYRLEENADGSKTVWMNEIERMFGTKGMAGFTLHPGKAYLEIKAQLYNRTSLPQTFLWWANPAVKVNDHYQSVFPPDVNAVFDHGKRDVSAFPIATGTYYKVDYSPGTDISRYKNIPVPTSYMAINSAYDFMGGYEHDTKAGVLHVASHHVSPGKKQWTWGYSDFGRAWDRNLTDEDGPYIELMTGVFTDNQPDFSWLMPFEEKSFTQYFMPYRELGMVKNATKDLVLNLEKEGKQVNIKVFATSEQPGLTIVLKDRGHVLLEEQADLSPLNIFDRTFAVAAEVQENNFILQVQDKKGKILISYAPANNTVNSLPEAAKPALMPEEIKSNEQLFLTAQHLEQYRHATYSPLPYYEEALKRDPQDARCNNALGSWYLRRGKFEFALPFFRRAIATLSARNPNPYDGEPYYNLGVCLCYLGQFDAAFDAFYKACWNSAWQDGAYFFLAAIDLRRNDPELALEHIDHSLDRNARNNKAYVLKSIALRKKQQPEAAAAVCRAGLERDSFNLGLLFEQYLLKKTTLDAFVQLSRSINYNLLAYAIDYAACGCYAEAIEILNLISSAGSSPMIHYYLGYFYAQTGAAGKAAAQFQMAAHADPYLCFPNRLEDIMVLEHAVKTNQQDARAPYYLGNLWFDKRQYAEAIKQWENAALRDPNFPTTLRNLGIAAFNKENVPDKALKYFEQAFKLDPSDARVMMELDQLYKRLQKKPAERLRFLEEHLDTLLIRDDLYLERVALYNFTDQFQQAYSLIMDRKFHPWEGGEGKVSGQYLYSLVQMARAHIRRKEYHQAITCLEKAQEYPHNLGEGKLYGAQENDLFYWLGICYEALGENSKAQHCYQKASSGSKMLSAAVFYNDQAPDKIFYQGLAMQKLGMSAEAKALFESFITYGRETMNAESKIDYFAVSLPDLLIFEDDPFKRNNAHAHFIMGLGYLGLGEQAAAANAFEATLGLDNMHFGAKQHLVF